MLRFRAPLCERLFVFYSLFVVFTLSAMTQVGQGGASQANVVLSGDVKGSQNHSYIEVPFRVPEGIQRITLTFHYTKRSSILRSILAWKTRRSFAAGAAETSRY